MNPPPTPDGASSTPGVPGWAAASRHALNSYVEANRAFLAGFGLETSDDERTDASLPELAFVSPEWTTVRSVERHEDLAVGEFVEFSKRIGEEDVRAFAEASGDTNRLHLDEAFASGTRFRGRIVHGTLVAGLVSAALARLPGLTIYLSEELSFTAPAEIGARLTARCEIVEDLGEHRYRLVTEVSDEEGTVLIDGEAVVLVDELP
ncbi:MaoC family dehydratase [Natronorarus salvus]|uniref:MaoC family dehydratase n=1 Tax=Natronorarus salvus TaxID=3117733 RepID=UPI002F264072